MNESTSLLSAPGCRRLVWLAAAVVMAISVLALAGWAEQSWCLTAFLPGRAPMRPNAAVGFILSGLALVLVSAEASRPEFSRGCARAARICAGLAGLLGLFTMLEAAYEWDPGLDRLLFPTALASLPMAHPGRLPPAVALGFLLLGLALGLLTVRSNRIDGLAQCLLLAVALIGLAALEGHLFGVAAIYRATEPAAVPLPSAVLMVVLALGGMAARPDCGLMAELTGEYPGSAMARRLLPVVVLLPIGLGFLKLAGLSHGYFTGDLGEALFGTAYLSILSALVLSSARSLNHSHAERRLAEEHHRRLAEIVNCCDDAIIG